MEATKTIQIEEASRARTNALALWQTIRDYPLPFGAKYLEYKYKWSTEFALGAINEYRRFAFMALTSATEITPSYFVDEVWHVHILHTKDYSRFARSCGGFLHHNPGMPSEEGERFRAQYAQTLEVYRNTFGEEPSAEIWPPLKKPEPTIAQVLELFQQRRLAAQS